MTSPELDSHARILIGALFGLALGGAIATGGWLLRHSDVPALAAAEVSRSDHAANSVKPKSAADDEPSFWRLAALLFYSALRANH